MNIYFRVDLSQYAAHRPSVLYWVVQPSANVGGIGMGRGCPMLGCLMRMGKYIQRLIWRVVARSRSLPDWVARHGLTSRKLWLLSWVLICKRTSSAQDNNSLITRAIGLVRMESGILVALSPALINTYFGAQMRWQKTPRQN